MRTSLLTVCVLLAAASVPAGVREDQLFEAVRHGQDDRVAALLDQGAAIEAEEKGYTPLIIALSTNHAQTASLLLNRGAKVTHYAPDGYTPLVGAMGLGDIDLVRLLLDKGADPNAGTRDDYGDLYSCPLYRAANRGHTAIVTLLLDRGAKVDAVVSLTGSTPLTAACRRGHLETARLLLDRGAAVNPTVKDYAPHPLGEAVKGGHREIVRLLLDHGATVLCFEQPRWVWWDIHNNDDLKYEPLTYARARGDEQILLMLIQTWRQQRKLPNSPEHQREDQILLAAAAGDAAALGPLLEPSRPLPDAFVLDTALLLAYQRGHVAAVRQLQDPARKALESMAHRDRLNEALTKALEKKDNARALALLEAGAGYTPPQLLDFRPYEEALERGNLAAVRIMLDRGAPVQAQWDVKSPLYRATGSGNLELVKLLVERGAAIDRKAANGMLYDFCRQGHTAGIAFALDHGSLVNQTWDVVGGQGYTPLMFAASSGSTSAVALLLERGANPGLRNTEGSTALSMARGPEMIALLTPVSPVLPTQPAGRNTPNPTELSNLVSSNDVEGVRKALAAGADPNANTSYEFYSPLYNALFNQHYEIAKLLLESEAHGRPGEPNLGMVIAKTPPVPVEIIQLLIAKGEPLNTAGQYGQTPLMIAVAVGREDIAKLLLGAGADASIKDPRGRSALDIAKELNNTALVQLLSAARK